VFPCPICPEPREVLGEHDSSDEHAKLRLFYLKPANFARNSKPTRDNPSSILSMSSYEVYLSAEQAGNSGNQIDSTSIFVSGLLPLILFSLSSIGAALSSTNLEISIAVANVVAMMQTHKLNNPRSVMVFVGIISSITFAFLFYWYITTFIEKIWNRFFVQAYDKPLFWLWLGLQVILLIIIFFKPSWWWIFPLSSYFVILLITGHRLSRTSHLENR
jgi:hypothetical protein